MIANSEDGQSDPLQMQMLDSMFQASAQQARETYVKEHNYLRGVNQTQILYRDNRN